MERIKVLIVDNEDVFREGLAKLLKNQPHIDVVYQCGSDKEAIEKGRGTNPDIILLGSQILDLDVLEAVQKIRKQFSEAKLAVISRLGGTTGSLSVLKAGARACLAKSISANHLVKSVELISSGRIVISPVFAEKFLAEIVAAEKADEEKNAEMQISLSKREIEIAILLAEGATNKEVAGKLFIAESTVKVHVSNILKKLTLRNRQQLAAYAVLQHWVAAAPTVEEDASSE